MMRCKVNEKNPIREEVEEHRKNKGKRYIKKKSFK